MAAASALLVALVLGLSQQPTGPISAIANAGPSAPTPIQRFFLGCTQGRGNLKVTMRRARAVAVDSFGYLAEDGTLVVRQTVQPQGKPTTKREWRLREIGLGRFRGKLSTASGEVTGQSSTTGLQLSFPMKRGLRAQQALTLSNDGRSIVNAMTVRKFGVVVARLDETIVRCGVDHVRPG